MLSKREIVKKRLAESVIFIWIIFVGVAYALIFVIPKIKEIISR